MGYYTYYSIVDVQGPAEVVATLQRDFSCGVIQTEYDSLNEMFESIPGSALDSMKWYGWRDDMVEISQNYPNTLIVLSGEGEESGDIWRAYFRNGEVEVIRPELLWGEPSEAILNNDVIVFDNEDLPDEDF